MGGRARGHRQWAALRSQGAAARLAGRVPRGGAGWHRAGALPFTLASAGTFPGDEGVVFLAPVEDEALLRMHRDWRAIVPGGTPYYAPGAWVPHCTVGIRLPDVAPAIAAARALLPIRGRYEAIGLVEFDAKGMAPVRRLVERRLAP